MYLLKKFLIFMKISKFSNAVGHIRSVCVQWHSQTVPKVFLTFFIISMKSTSTFEKHIRTMHETYVSDEFLTMQHWNLNFFQFWTKSKKICFPVGHIRSVCVRRRYNFFSIFVFFHILYISIYFVLCILYYQCRYYRYSFLII